MPHPTPLWLFYDFKASSSESHHPKLESMISRKMIRIESMEGSYKLLGTDVVLSTWNWVNPAVS